MFQTANATVYYGNNLDVLPTLPDNSVDAIVTDPPYELGFMGKTWDSSGIAYSVELWQECLRVLKPGGHLLAFSGSRTYHRQTVAIEDAGFEIRDMISWISNKTFPKSHNISKAIDKLAGAERQVIGTNQNVVRDAKIAGGSDFGGFTKANADITAPATDDAKKWEGWGTALKPTVEPIVLARKPLIGTVAENVLAYGTGGLNIDASRIGTADNLNGGKKGGTDNEIYSKGLGETSGRSMELAGRFPANVILDETAAQIVDEQSGTTKSPKTYVRNADGFGKTSYGAGQTAGTESINYGDEGGASRFFYVARASKTDRNEGLDELPKIDAQNWNGSTGHRGVGDYYPDGTPRPANPKQNFHPTVKPTALMTYLIRLITPPGGTVLDPFTGSGSTGKAAILNGNRFIGIELTDDYHPIIEGRLTHAEQTLATQKGETLF